MVNPKKLKILDNYWKKYFKTIAKKKSQLIILKYKHGKILLYVGQSTRIIIKVINLILIKGNMEKQKFKY